MDLCFKGFVYVFIFDLATEHGSEVCLVPVTFIPLLSNDLWPLSVTDYQQRTTFH